MLDILHHLRFLTLPSLVLYKILSSRSEFGNENTIGGWFRSLAFRAFCTSSALGKLYLISCTSARLTLRTRAAHDARLCERAPTASGRLALHARAAMPHTLGSQVSSNSHLLKPSVAENHAEK